MLCSSLPTCSSRTSPTTKSSRPASAIDCSEALCRFGSEGAKRRVAIAIDGPEPSGSRCEYMARKTATGRPSPYPIFPLSPIRSTEKTLRSTEKPGGHVGATAVAAGRRAGQERQAALQRHCPVSSIAERAGSSNTRSTGRFATERSVHFQSSSSAAPRIGPTRMAFSRVFRVIFR